jgi:hypothetical protein
MNNNGSTNITGQSDFIYSSYLDLSTLIAPISLTFDVAYARYDGTYIDSLFVSVTSDCGSTWTKVYNKGGSSLATAPDNTGTFVPTSTQWRTESIDLSNFAGLNALKVAFENKSGWGQALYIDNINLFNSPLVVDEINLNNSFNIYPNPNNGEFNIAINTPTSGNINVKVMNVLGKTVYLKNISNASNGIYNVDLSTEAQGIYFVEIITPTEKVVKKINVL